MKKIECTSNDYLRSILRCCSPDNDLTPLEGHLLASCHLPSLLWIDIGHPLRPKHHLSRLLLRG